jgi:hypothetical protein
MTKAGVEPEEFAPRQESVLDDSVRFGSGLESNRTEDEGTETEPTPNRMENRRFYPG